MDMVADGLTREEKDRLYGMSVIPMVLVFAVAIFYYGFVHLEQVYPPESLMWDALINLFPPVAFGMPVAFCLTFEILYSRKMKCPPKFHVKRFLGRMVTVLVGALSFFAIYLASYFFLAPVISERFAILCSFWIWLLAFGTAIVKFRKLFSRLEGEW